MEHYALAQLAKCRQSQLLFQLRLARKNDLQEFAPRRLEIEQQANFIESSQRETLCFIEDKHRQILGGMTLKKPAVQSFDKFAFGTGLTRYTEIAQDKPQKPDRFQMSMENVGT